MRLGMPISASSGPARRKTHDAPALASGKRVYPDGSKNEFPSAFSIFLPLAGKPVNVSDNLTNACKAEQIVLSARVSPLLWVPGRCCDGRATWRCG